jgi:hypothetical protein
MDASGDTGKATAPQRAPAPQAEAATPAPHPASDHPFGPDGAAILAAEHWSLLASRSLIWNEAISRATVFLSVLSASTIALALLADATGFGPQTTTLALVLLPVVLFLGIAAHGRLVEINREEVELVLAMNRLRRAYLPDRARPGALLHHRPPRRRAGPGGQLPGRRSASGAVGPVPGRHADDRRDGGRRACGGDRRAGGAGGRGRHDGRRGGGGAGVPGRLGGAVLPATPRPGCAAADDAEVPHAARRGLNDLPVRPPRSSRWSAAAHGGLRRSRQPPQANTQHPEPLGRGCREDDRLGIEPP